MKEAVRYIDLHYNQKVQIRELADYVGVNRSYLASSFQRTLGCSPRAYLIRVRMEKAREMRDSHTKNIRYSADSERLLNTFC